MDKETPVHIHIELSDGTKYDIETTKEQLQCATTNWEEGLPTCEPYIKFSLHDELAED